MLGLFFMRLEKLMSLLKKKTASKIIKEEIAKINENAKPEVKIS